MSWSIILHNCLGQMIKSVWIFIGILMFSSFIGAVWYCYTTSIVNEKVLMEIHPGRLIRNDSIIGVVSGFGIIVFFGLLGYFLYFKGKHFVLHATSVVLTIICIFAFVIIGIVIPVNTRPEKRKTFETDFFKKLEQSPPEGIFHDWMNDNNCESAIGCRSAVQKFLKRYKITYIGTIFFLLCEFVPIGSLVTIACLMCCIRPINEDNYGSTPSDLIPIPQEFNAAQSVVASPIEIEP